MCESDALAANEDAWSGNELMGLVFPYSTERAVAEVSRFLKCNLSGHGLDNLMHSLVAQAESFGDFPKAAPCRMEPANSVLVVHLGAVGFELKLNDPVPGLTGFPQQSFVQRHCVYHSRRSLEEQSSNFFHAMFSRWRGKASNVGASSRSLTHTPRPASDSSSSVLGSRTEG